MGWEIANSWDELQFVNYSHSEEFQDGRIAFWRTEDWEIYGPGGGGYTSSGPFGSVEGDLQAWINSGSLLAPDVLTWSTGDYSTSSSRPNFNRFQSASADRRAAMKDLLVGGAVMQIDSYALKGGAKPFNGNANPQVGQGGIEKNDIAVTARKRHANMSESTRYRVFDPYSNQYTDVSETMSFCDIQRRESDANVIVADYSLIGGPTPPLETAFQTAKTYLQAIIANLLGRAPGAGFDIRYTNLSGTAVTGRITTAELLSWFRLVDFEFHPALTNFGNGGVGITAYRNGYLLQRQDVTFKVDEAAFRTFMGSEAGAIWFLVHEIIHASRFGQAMFRHFGNGDPLESRVNAIARAIASNLTYNITNYAAQGGGYSLDPTTTFTIRN